MNAQFVDLMNFACGEILSTFQSHDLDDFLSDSNEKICEEFFDEYRMVVESLLREAIAKIPSAKPLTSPKAVKKFGKKIMSRRLTHVHAFNNNNNKGINSTIGNAEDIGSIVLEEQQTSPAKTTPSIDESNSEYIETESTDNISKLSKNEDTSASVELSSTTNMSTTTKGKKPAKKIMPRRPTHSHAFNGQPPSKVSSSTTNQLTDIVESLRLTANDTVVEGENEEDDDCAESTPNVDTNETSAGGIDDPDELDNEQSKEDKENMDVLLSRVETAESQLAIALMEIERLQNELNRLNIGTMGNNNST